MSENKNIKISFPFGIKEGEKITICGSKSQSNRYLMLSAVLGSCAEIKNTSDSEDTAAMLSVLTHQDKNEINIGHAGTAMRFGTAYLASQEGVDVVLTGSERMLCRPIAPLVTALKSLGADISYMGNEGFPPLKIKGKKIPGGQCKIDSSVSSQFITALMLAAPSFEKGLTLTLEGRMVSVPYIKMTMKALSDFGCKSSLCGNVITVEPMGNVVDKALTVESDWSSAAFYYSLVAVSGKDVYLSYYKENSSQGDSAVVNVFKNFGVETHFVNGGIHLERKEGFVVPSVLNFDMENTPDMAQSVAVTMATLGVKGTLTGLSTLRVKETDRIAALVAELKKFGVVCGDTEDTITILSFGKRDNDILLKTYQDHRMAMSFSVMACKGGFIVEQADVVGKSYPRFWDDFKKLGLVIE
ncbi:MAG: 3-phosphoshikimate 1-carboxyvinyltransferase [Flavobacteriales bacterium]|nr:3-phosphoshikimate 1-carboxyvinyltransferase [Flavobacteriales bacterium]